MTSTSPDILPPIGYAAPPRFHPAIWPLTDIADEFGTPTYVIDEADFRARAGRYRAAWATPRSSTPASRC